MEKSETRYLARKTWHIEVKNLVRPSFSSDWARLFEGGWIRKPEITLLVKYRS
jgi:hypothetical protein